MVSLSLLTSEVSALRKTAEQKTATSAEVADPMLALFRNKPFWIWNEQEHARQHLHTAGRCCFNHILGMPIRDGKEMPMFDYEREIYDSLQHYDQLWVKKARGLGVTEFFLRYMAWLCLRNDDYAGSQMAIIVGPSQQLGIDMIERFKERIGLQKFFHFDSDKKTVRLNRCTIVAYPSNHTETLRSPEAMRFIFLDEADFFNAGEINVVMSAIAGYAAKTRPIVVLVSTPNNPGGFYDRSERDSKFPYHKQILLFERGMPKLKTPNVFGTTTWSATVNMIIERYGEAKIRTMSREDKKALAVELANEFCADPSEVSIYRLIDIVVAALDASFQREYCGQYGYGHGNLFGPQVVDAIIEDYPMAMQDGEKVLCLDPAFGNAEKASKFGVVGLEQVNGVAYVRLAKQVHRASPVTMTEDVIRTFVEGGYHVCLVDGSQAGTINDLRNGVPQLNLPGIPVIPIYFKDKLTEMSTTVPRRCRERRVRISPMFPELIAQLRAVEMNDKGHPDKRKLGFDLGDAFMEGVNYYGEGVVLMDAL